MHLATRRKGGHEDVKRLIQLVGIVCGEQLDLKTPWLILEDSVTRAVHRGHIVDC